MSPTCPTCSEVRKIIESWPCLDSLHLFCLFPVLHEGTPWTHLHFHLAIAWQKAQTTYKKKLASYLPGHHLHVAPFKTSFTCGNSYVAPIWGWFRVRNPFQFCSFIEDYIHQLCLPNPWLVGWSLSLHSCAASNMLSSQHPPAIPFYSRLKFPLTIDLC